MTISSRTPEGASNDCPICGTRVRIDPSRPPGDAPCPNCGHLLWFETPSVTVVEFHDIQELDDAAMEEVTHLANDPRPFRLLVDLQNVLRCSSAVLSHLLQLCKTRRQQSGTLVLCNLSPQFPELMRITALDTVMDIRADVKDGLKAFTQ
jgi:anti-anti-sigma factor